jgi:chaperonin GroES
MAFQPLQDRVLVERTPNEDTTKGGLIIPDTAQEKPLQGLVVAVGPGKRTETGSIVPTTVQAGDRILFGKWAGIEITLDGKELVVLKEDEIFGILS